MTAPTNSAAVRSPASRVGKGDLVVFHAIGRGILTALLAAVLLGCFVRYFAPDITDPYPLRPAGMKVWPVVVTIYGGAIVLGVLEGWRTWKSDREQRED